MNTPMEEYLEKLAIIGSGVPSVIMEYTDVADYAKSIVTANIKFAGRVASLDSDLEEATTLLYKALLKTSSLPDDIKNKAINSFQFKLARPKVLTNSNMSDYLSQVEQITRSIATLYIGENDDNEDQTKTRQLFTKKLAADMLPFISWDKYEDLLQQSAIEVASKKDLNNNSNNMSDDSNLDDDML